MLIIKIENNNIEKGLKQYKRKVFKTKQLKKLKELKHFIKPSEINRLQTQKAQFVQSKKTN